MQRATLPFCITSFLKTSSTFPTRTPLETLLPFPACDHHVVQLFFSLVLDLYAAHIFFSSAAACLYATSYSVENAPNTLPPCLTWYYASLLSHRVWNTFSAFERATGHFLRSLAPDSKSHVLHRAWPPLVPSSALLAQGLVLFSSRSKHTHSWILSCPVALKASFFRPSFGAKLFQPHNVWWLQRPNSLPFLMLHRPHHSATHHSIEDMEFCPTPFPCPPGVLPYTSPTFRQCAATYSHIGVPSTLFKTLAFRHLFLHHSVSRRA